MYRFVIIGVLGLAVGGGTAGAVSFASSAEVAELRADFKDLAAKFDEVRDELRNDRFTRTDHVGWIRDELRPWQRQIENEVRSCGCPAAPRPLP